MATTWEELCFRFRNDDGSETSATWKAALNVVPVITADVPFRVRFELLETGTTGYPWSGGMQYSRNGGAWTSVSLGSTVVRASASAYVTNGTSSTQQLDMNSGFRPGRVTTNANSSGSSLVNQGQFTEQEFCLVIRSVDISIGDVIQIRASDSYPTVFDYIPSISFGVNVSVNLTGVQGAKGVGSLTGAGLFNGVTGVKGTGSAGVALANTPITVSLVGVAGTKGVGTVAGTGGIRVAATPTGVTKTATAGTVVASGTGTVAVALVGVGDVGAAGAMAAEGTASVAANVTGVGDVCAAGTVAAGGSVGASVALTGVQDALAVGTLAVVTRLDVTATLGTALSTAALGALGVISSVGVTVSLGSALGTSAHGTLVVSLGSTAVYATGALTGASTAHGSALRSPPVTGVLSGTSTARATPDGSRVHAPAWGNSAVRAGAQVSRVARATARSQALVLGLAGHVTVATGQTLTGSSTAHATQGAHLVTGVAVAHGTSSVLVAAQVIPAAEGEIDGAGDAAAHTQVAYSAEGVVLAGDRYDLDGNPQPSTTLAYAGSTCHAAAAAHGGSRAKASVPAPIAATAELTGSSSAFYLDVATYDDEALEGMCSVQATTSVSMNTKALSVNRCYAVATLSYHPVLLAGTFVGGSMARSLATVAWNERPPR